MCRDRQLACHAFAQFVHSPHGRRSAERIPTATVYRRLFGDDNLS